MNDPTILAVGVLIGGTLGSTVGYTWGTTRNKFFKQHRYDARGLSCIDCGRSRTYNEEKMYQACSNRLATRA